MKTAKQRFEEKFYKADNRCWIWTAGCIEGYGSLRIDGKNVLAHRFSYTLYKGNIPEMMLILHKCNNRKCVNPEHLYPGTYSDNMQDSMDAGDLHNPNCRGSMCGSAKLDEDIVTQIKKMLRDNIPRWLIAWTFRVTQQAISNISTGKTWKHVSI